jgi:hypothetical protein
MGNMVMGECKNGFYFFNIVQYNYNIPKEDMEDLHWVMFTHAMELFQECASLKKLIPKHLFTS